jgi:type IV pilus assembly protein PilW
MRASHMQRYSRRQHGFSLIEIMVGIVIGLIAVLVIYQIFAAAEGIKRNTTSVGDAQQNGLLSSFMLSIELANASNGVASALQQFGTCAPTADIATTFSPIPILITDGGATGPDQFVVNYSQANVAVAPAPFYLPAAADAPYAVVAPLGFNTGDIVVAISETGVCEAHKITGVAGPDLNGVVTLTHTTPSQPVGAGAFLVNMGPSGTTQRTLYDVDVSSGVGVLRSSILWDANGNKQAVPIPVPLASNIVTMKLQYYVLDPATNTFSWVSATPPWDAPTLLGLAPPNNVTTLQRIRAVRIGVVVQGEQYDKDLAAQVPAPTWSLFGGGGTLTGALTPGFRYRTYETIVPLRNPVWNL